MKDPMSWRLFLQDIRWNIVFSCFHLLFRVKIFYILCNFHKETIYIIIIAYVLISTANNHNNNNNNNNKTVWKLKKKGDAEGIDLQ
jgi:hypothetical protein